MSKKTWLFLIIVAFLSIFLLDFFGFFDSVISYQKGEVVKIDKVEDKIVVPVLPPLDTVDYDNRMEELANNPIPKVVVPQKDKDGNDIPIPFVQPKINFWPVKTVYPNPGAILPFNRIIAYYGNLYSTKMGVLGQYLESEMLEKLKTEVKKWDDADPTTPAIPALHYIAVVAQGSPGTDGKYKLRMPGSEIDKVLAMAAKINAIVFLDIQVGFSNVETEVPLLEKYLKYPNVHLGIDPEFSMKGTIRPGKVVGTLDGVDINFASNYLANLVKENNLTPKILIIHRYTQKMVTNYKLIKTTPEVQIVMNMDGWGEQARKVNTYQQFIYKEPVQFTGFKLFYKNDILNPGTVLMTPESLLKLSPRPIYIQYQ
ncbi:MAG: hypothetical protein WCP17_02310 [bacterium]